MDAQLIEIMGDKEESKLDIDPLSQTVSIVGETGEACTPYPVKPLKELYGKGTGLPHVEFTDDRFMPLLAMIEGTFIRAWKQHPALSDASLLAALDRLCMSPDGDVSGDPLAAMVQFDLRIALSLNDYSREDLRHSLRKIRQSVARHNKLSGTRGYLNFIRTALKA